MQSSALVARCLCLFVMMCTAVYGQIITVIGDGCGSTLKPGVPGLAAKATGPYSIQVTWNEPSNGACVDKYSVYVQPKYKSLSALSSPLPIISQTYKVDVNNLQPDTEYWVYVIAEGPGGTGGGYKWGVSVHTDPKEHEEDPCGSSVPYPPRRLLVTPISSTVIKAAWDASRHPDCVDKYEVYVSPRYASLKSFAQPWLWTRDYSLKVDHLKPNTEYSVTVRAVNEWGPSPTVQAYVKTLPSKLLGLPVDLASEVITAPRG